MIVFCHNTESHNSIGDKYFCHIGEWCVEKNCTVGGLIFHDENASTAIRRSAPAMTNCERPYPALKTSFVGLFREINNFFIYAELCIVPKWIAIIGREC